MTTATTQNSKDIRATQEALYNAFINPDALGKWLAPGEMTGRVHNFDLKVGGGYEMSLYYPSTERESRGKTAEKEDRFTARFIELAPFKKIVQAINFESTDPAFAGEMIMDVTLTAIDDGTRVTVIFKNIPAGIQPEDNEKGTELTLQKLARYVA